MADGEEILRKAKDTDEDIDLSKQLKEKLSTIFSDSSSDNESHISGKSDYKDEAFEECSEDTDFQDDMSTIVDVLERNGTPQFVDQTKTFSQKELHEIERKNAILMEKILANNRRKNKYIIPPKFADVKKVASAAINRRKKQESINRDNQILLRKLQSVKPAVKNSMKK